VKPINPTSKRTVTHVPALNMGLRGLTVTGTLGNSLRAALVVFFRGVVAFVVLVVLRAIF